MSFPLKVFASIQINKYNPSTLFWASLKAKFLIHGSHCVKNTYPQKLEGKPWLTFYLTFWKYFFSFHNISTSLLSWQTVVLNWFLLLPKTLLCEDGKPKIMTNKQTLLIICIVDTNAHYATISCSLNTCSYMIGLALPFHLSRWKSPPHSRVHFIRDRHAIKGLFV